MHITALYSIIHGRSLTRAFSLASKMTAAVSGQKVAVR